MAEQPLHEHTLGNGLRVVVCEDHVVPLAAVNIWYAVGSRHEQTGVDGKSRTGLAHLFEHLMFQGSANVAEGEHAALLESAGATFNASTSFERTNYYETVPVSHLELALWLEADRMGTLPAALTQANLDNQRDVVKNERRQRYDNQPYGTAFERLCRLTFPPGHPYAHTPIGSMEDLDATTIEDCVEFFRTWYAPGNAVLSVVGDVDPGAVIEMAERYFGAIPAGPAAPPARPGGLEPLTEVRLEEVDEEVPSPAYFAMLPLPVDGGSEIEAAELAVEIIGGGTGSRLYDRMVRRDQIATEVWTGVTRMVGGPSLAIVEAVGPDPAKIAEVLDEELARFAAEGPTEDETARATAQAERGLLERTETVTGLANALSANATQFGDPARTFTAAARAAAVTAEEIKDAARRWLAPGARTALSYGGAR
ncbi:MULTISPECIES: M16 family metallopeptidase [Thermomonospora]|uniref:Putative Zn-dependent peptidase n=1 Tax=Thermomonospora cellulosilytica TaxID=1411118 RepID=A0A7W3MWX4_9ACTN|nr:MULTISPECIES: pitrilysin family protein [Thermomonospora]MBA9003429.1 putative Zn-dependent peptidase [Thermomonospora cellulosilytica]